MERSTRTVFAYNLSLKADERQVFEFFSQAGTVNDVKIITDKNTRRCADAHQALCLSCRRRQHATPCRCTGTGSAQEQRLVQRLCQHHVLVLL